MDFKFSKDADPENKQPATEKGSQNSLLLLLLILIGGFAYLYFFTGLIRPQQEQKSAEAPAPQVIKNPLPPPAGQNGAVPAAPAATALSATPEQKSPEPAPATTAAVQEPQKNIETPKVDPKSKKKDLSSVPAAVSATPKSSAAKEVKKASSSVPVSGKKPVAAAVTPKAPKEKTHAVSGTKTAKASTGKPAIRVPDASAVESPWTVVVGVYTLEDTMATDMVRVRKAGFDASVQAGPRKTMVMNRLYLSEFPERSAALSELNKLKRHTSDAFILEQSGTFAVYAGSYLLDARAASERERLAAAGYPLTVKRVDVSIPTRKLTAGRFSNKQAAEAALRKLKSAGLKPALTR